MTTGVTALLFAPPQPPQPLPVDGTVVIGRSRSCDLRLADGDTSRRHAKIVCTGGRYVLHDLGSTNGTRVNGEPVGEHALEPADRIDIGANTITFCRVDAELTEAPGDGEAPTLLRDRPRRGDALTSAFSGL